MNSEAIVFAGPTLHGCTLPPTSGIQLRPPATAGDIAKVVGIRPRAIGLIDGLFGSRPSVRHWEILAALDAGIPVYGAASLGAIRAAELADFGMIGVGALFQAYAAGLETRDDAVLVSHGPVELGYPPLTIALVEAEAAIKGAALEAAVELPLLRRARRLPYFKRDWNTLLGDLPHELSARVRANHQPLKQVDALALFEALRSLDAPDPNPAALSGRAPNRYTASARSGPNPASISPR